MKKIKTILSIILLISISLWGCGCSMTNYFDNSKGINEITEYLNNKYEDEFTYVGKFGGTFDNDKNEYEFSSSKYPEYSIWVAQDRKDGTIVDNYLSLKFHEQVKNDLQSIINAISPNNLFFIEFDEQFAHTSIGNESEDVSYEEYVSNPNAELSFVAFMDTDVLNDNKQVFEENLSVILKEKNIHFLNFTIYFIDDMSEELIKDSNARDLIISNDDFSSRAFALLDEDSFSYNWRWS